MTWLFAAPSPDAWSLSKAHRPRASSGKGLRTRKLQSPGGGRTLHAQWSTARRRPTLDEELACNDASGFENDDSMPGQNRPFNAARPLDGGWGINYITSTLLLDQVPSPALRSKPDAGGWPALGRVASCRVASCELQKQAPKALKTQAGVRNCTPRSAELDPEGRGNPGIVGRERQLLDWFPRVKPN
jgi:hypothetical protein